MAHYQGVGNNEAIVKTNEAIVKRQSLGGFTSGERI